jgi:hypothetical protein
VTKVKAVNSCEQSLFQDGLRPVASHVWENGREVLSVAHMEGAAMAAGTLLALGGAAPDFAAETSQGPIRFHEWLGQSWGYESRDGSAPRCVVPCSVLFFFFFGAKLVL